MSKIVCRCANVFEQDVRNFIKEYPKAGSDVIKSALGIGIGCGSCCSDCSEVTDVTIEEILNTNDV